MMMCTSPLLLATTLLLLFGSLAQAFVTTGLQSSSPGSPIAAITTNNGPSESIATTSSDDDEEEETDDDFSSMMGVQAAASPGQTVYVIEFESEADKASGSSHRNRGGKDIMSDDVNEGQSPLDPWSIVWYIGSFGGLIAFFLIVSCSEWCCRRGARPLNIPYTQRGEVINASGTNQGLVTESPPPPYHLFAPPPYDSVNYAEIADSKGPSAEKLDIYVISLPIQAAPAQPPPA